MADKDKAIATPNSIFRNGQVVSYGGNQSATNIAYAEMVVIGSGPCIDNRNASKINWDALQNECSNEEIEEVITQELQRETTSTEDLEAALKVLLTLSEDFGTPRLDILNIIISLLQKHPQALTIQKLGLSNLLNIKNEFSLHSHKEHLEKIVEETLCGLRRFPNDRNIFRISVKIFTDLWRCFNSLNSQCSTCIKLILKGVGIFCDPSIQTSAWKTIQNLIEILPKKEFLSVFEENQHKIYFGVVKEKLRNRLGDQELYTVLNILKNLTVQEEIQGIIIAESYLDVITDLLQKFEEEDDVMCKTLPILEYISRQETSTVFILNPQVLGLLMKFVKSNDIQTSYLAASVLCYIVFHREDSWPLSTELLQKINFSIKKAEFNKWCSPNEKLTKYNSLLKVQEILKKTHNDGVLRHFAWTLNHFCCNNPKKYLKLIKEEKILPNILQIVNTDKSEEVKILLNSIITTVYKTANTNEEILSVEIILHLLAEDKALSDDKVLLYLKKLVELLNEELYSESTANILQVALQVAENYKHCVEIHIEITKCLECILNVTNSQTDVTCMKSTLIYICSCVKLFFGKEELITPALKVLFSALNSLTTKEHSPFVEFSQFDEDKRLNGQEFGIDFVGLTAQLLQTMFALEKVTQIAESCIKCACLFIKQMSAKEMNDLIAKQDLRQQLYTLTKQAGSDSSMPLPVLEALLAMLHWLSHTQSFKQFWLKESKLELFTEILRKHSCNLNILKRSARILSRFEPEYRIQDTMGKYIDAFGPTRASYFYLSIFLMPQPKKEKEYDWFPKPKTDNDHLTLIFKLWNMDSEIVHSLSYICNNFLVDKSMNRRLYAAYVLNGLVAKAPKMLKEKLMELGDLQELEMITKGESANDTIATKIKTILDIINPIEISDVDCWSMSQVKCILKDNLSTPEDIQRCLHWLQKFHKLVTTSDVNVILKRMKEYSQHHGIQREAIRLFCTDNVIAKTDLKDEMLENIMNGVKKFKTSKSINYLSVLYIGKMDLTNMSSQIICSVIRYFYLITGHINNYCKHLGFSDLKLNPTPLSLLKSPLDSFRDTYITFLESNSNSRSVVLCFLKFLVVFYDRARGDLNIECQEWLLSFLIGIMNHFPEDDDINCKLIVILFWFLNRNDDLMLSKNDISHVGNEIITLCMKVVNKPSTSQQCCAICVAMHLKLKWGQLLDENFKCKLMKIMANFDVRKINIVYMGLVNMWKDLRLREYLTTDEIECKVYVAFVVLYTRVHFEMLGCTCDLIRKLNCLNERCSEFNVLRKKVNDHWFPSNCICQHEKRKQQRELNGRDTDDEGCDLM